MFHFLYSFYNKKKTRVKKRQYKTKIFLTDNKKSINVNKPIYKIQIQLNNRKLSVQFLKL